MYHLRLFCLEYIGSTSLEIHFLCGMQKRKGKGGGEGLFSTSKALYTIVC